MKKRVLITALVLILGLMGILVGCADNGDTEPSTPKYELVFSDDFDGDSIDLSKWRLGDGTTERRGAYYPHESSNVFVENGALTIRTNYQKDGKYGEGWYTGWVETSSPGNHKDSNAEEYKGFASRFGYYEVRCVPPRLKGAWSAFWLMPDPALGAKGMGGEDIYGSFIDGCEIDVMESLYYGHPIFNGEYNQNAIHGDGYGVDEKIIQSGPYKIEGIYDEYHTYGVLWTPDEFVFYVDRVEKFRTNCLYGDDVLGTPQVPEYMVLSSEVWGGVVDGKRVADQIPNTAAAKAKNYDFKVDYVKVYQLNPPPTPKTEG